MKPPHNAAYGTPIQYRPAVTSAPNTTLIKVCHSRNWLTRYVASSMSRVVRLTLSEPSRRMNRSRRSSRWPSMNATSAMTMIVLAIGSKIASAALAQPLDRRTRRDHAHGLRAPHIGGVVVELLGHAIDGASELAEGRILARPQLRRPCGAWTTCSA